MVARSQGSRVRFDLRKKISTVMTGVLFINAVILLIFASWWGMRLEEEHIFKYGGESLSLLENFITSRGGALKEQPDFNNNQRSGMNRTRKSVEEYINQLCEGMPYYRSILVCDDEGRMIIHSTVPGGELLKTLPLAELQRRARLTSPDWLQVSQLTTKRPERIYVQVEYRRPTINWRNSILPHMIVILALTLGALFIAYFWSKRMARPLREVIAVTDEIARGREFREVTTRSTDEAGVIAEIFNDVNRRLQGRLNNMAVLQTCTMALGSQLEREQVYQLIVKTFADNSGAQKAALLLLGPGREHLAVAGGRNVISAKLRFATAEGLAGRAFQAAASAQSDGLRDHPDWCFFYPDQASAPTGAPTLAVPIVVQERVEGVILLTDCAGRENKPFDREEVLLFETLAGAAASALENARLYELAITDELTGIYVRRYYYQRLDHELILAAQQQSPLVLMMLDIDHFKSFNDRYGHQTGDQVLIALARLMRETVRDIDVVRSTRRRDIVARYGGEEFSIILPGTAAAGGLLVAERLRQNVERFEELVSDQGEPLKLTISIGVAAWEPGLDREPLIHRADDALYAAKRLGRNCVVLAGRDQPEPKG